MKLTQADIEQLREWGETDDAIKQIGEVADKYVKYKIGNKYASAAAVINLIGRHNWLAGINRCAFHYSAAQTAPNGLEVSFDASRYWNV